MYSYKLVASEFWQVLQPVAFSDNVVGGRVPAQFFMELFVRTPPSKKQRILRF